MINVAGFSGLNLSLMGLLCRLESLKLVPVPNQNLAEKALVEIAEQGSNYSSLLDGGSRDQCGSEPSGVKGKGEFLHANPSAGGLAVSRSHCAGWGCGKT